MSMSFEAFVPTAELCQSATIVISMTAYVPQWLTLWRNKSSEDLSLKSWSLWLVSSALAWFYALVMYETHGTGGVLLVTTTLTLFFISITTALILTYRRQPRDNKPAAQIASATAFESAQSSITPLDEAAYDNALKQFLEFSPGGAIIH